MRVVQKYINLYLHKLTIQNAISVAIQIASCFWVRIAYMHYLLVDAIAKSGGIYA